MTKKKSIEDYRIAKGADRDTITEDQIESVVRLHTQGMSYDLVASITGVARERTRLIVRQLEDGSLPIKFKVCPALTPSAPRKFSWEQTCST